ncbi:unnamed protein product, partial [Ascophyllum nodosum]
SNGCADLELSSFDKGKYCGFPLAHPCFDHSRCLLPPQGSGPRFYIYDQNCSLANSSELSKAVEISGEAPGGMRLDHRYIDWYWRQAAMEAGVLAEVYESACLFVHVKIHKANQPCALHAPLWNGGANHIMVDFSDRGRETRPKVANSLAMEAASHMHTYYYRSGYDLSIPLPPKNVFPGLATYQPSDRSFFLTMKGALYLRGHGTEERMSLVPLNDPRNGVVVALKCFEIHEEHLEPENIDFCATLKAKYNDFDYKHLMNTTFGVVPAGRSPATFRLAEVMSAGAIPVFVARDIVKPFSENYDWPSFSFTFSPDQVGPVMLQTLRVVPPDELAEMQ